MIELKEIFVINIPKVINLWEKEKTSAWGSEWFSGADGFKEV